MVRLCSFEHPDGRPCGAKPLRTGSLCFWHEPDTSEDAASARTLGGHRRRRERTLSVAYDVAGLGSIPAVRRLLEIATFDTLGLDNSLARNKVLLAGVVTAMKLIEAEVLASYGGDPGEDTS